MLKLGVPIQRRPPLTPTPKCGTKTSERPAGPAPSKMYGATLRKRW